MIAHIQYRRGLPATEGCYSAWRALEDRGWEIRTFEHIDEVVIDRRKASNLRLREAGVMSAPMSDFLVMVLILLGCLAAYSVLSAALLPASAWRAADRDQVVWVIVLILFWPSALPYMVKVRGEVQAAQWAALAEKSATAKSSGHSSKDNSVAPAAPVAHAPSGELRCSDCGFSSNPPGSEHCRNCNSKNLTGLGR